MKLADLKRYFSESFRLTLKCFNLVFEFKHWSKIKKSIDVVALRELLVTVGSKTELNAVINLGLMKLPFDGGSNL